MIWSHDLNMYTLRQPVLGKLVHLQDTHAYLEGVKTKQNPSINSSTDLRSIIH